MAKSREGLKTCDSGFPIILNLPSELPRLKKLLAELKNRFGIIERLQANVNQVSSELESAFEESEKDDDVRREIVFVDTAANTYQQLLVDDLLQRAEADRVLDVVLLPSTAIRSG